MTFEINELGFSFRSSDGASRTEVLRGVSGTIAEGEILAVVGPSGVGKTTLISRLGLLWDSSSNSSAHSVQGEIRYTDSSGRQFDFQRLADEEAAQLRRHSFGFALQSSYLLPHLTCVENVSIPMGLQGGGQNERLSTARRLFYGDLAGICDSKVSAISGGQRQRVSTLRAIVHDPDVVFADEPFSQLDTTNRDLLLQLLKDWHAGMLPGQESKRRTLILVCHDLGVAKAYGTQFLRLSPNFVCTWSREL